MQRQLLVLLVVAALAGLAVAWRFHHPAPPPHYTGVVEGEERILRAEVAGRIVEVTRREGETVEAGAVVASFDDTGIRAQLASKEQELAVHDAQIRAQRERIELIQTTWQRRVIAAHAAVDRARATADVAMRTDARLQQLLARGVATAQQVDDSRAQRDASRSVVEETEAQLANVEAQARNITLARQQLDTLQAERALAERQRDELMITLGKFALRAPDVATVVQTQFAWPGELAQPGTPILGVLDPLDKYVLVYVPVTDLAEFRVGRRVSLELDSQPGRRFAGEVSFVASEANFTPQKIETRSDRVGQVYRAKVRLLEGVAELQPGTEGDVYLEPAA